MKYQTWQEVIDLNNTNYKKATMVSGFPRGGTTYTYRCLCDYEPFCNKILLEEYFHHYYAYARDENGKLYLDKPTIDARVEQGVTINGGVKENEWYKEVGERYRDLRSTYSWHDVFMKVLPYHYRALARHNPIAYLDLCKSHFFIHVIRRDWFNMLLSNIYSNHFNKFHYYGAEELHNKPFIVDDVEDIIETYAPMFGILHKVWNDTNKTGVWIYAEDLPGRTVKTGDHVFIVPPPRHDKNKPELFKSIILNRDEIFDKAYTRFKKLEGHLEGFFEFSEQEVRINT